MAAMRSPPGGAGRQNNGELPRQQQSNVVKQDLDQDPEAITQRIKEYVLHAKPPAEDAEKVELMINDHRAIKDCAFDIMHAMNAFGQSMVEHKLFGTHVGYIAHRTRWTQGSVS